jgi:pyruvate/2-oxoglutarate dehydrogenase complex dihydrolipoamide dehydrogenase (E3) component
VAPGTEPSAPPIPGLADVPYWTNRDAVEAKRCPGSRIVPGGGAVGAELAQVFARFGVTVTVVEATDGLLPPEEPEAGELLYDVFTSEDIAVYTAAKTTNVHHDDGVFRVEMDDGNTVTAEQLIVATGRRADIASIGAGAIGVDEQVRARPVDERMGSPTVCGQSAT